MLQRYDKLPIRLVWRRGSEGRKIVARKRLEMPWETEGGIYAEKGGLYGGFQEGAIMGRFGNLLWVALTTHGRSHRRPTVGFFGDLP